MTAIRPGAGDIVVAVAHPGARWHIFQMGNASLNLHNGFEVDLIGQVRGGVTGHTNLSPPAPCRSAGRVDQSSCCIGQMQAGG